MNRIYLDHNATTPMHPDVLEAMLPYFKGDFGNASSIHSFGQEANRAMEKAREQVALLVGPSPGRSSSPREARRPTTSPSAASWRQPRKKGTW